MALPVVEAVVEAVAAGSASNPLLLYLKQQPHVEGQTVADSIAINVEGVSKRFGKTLALDHVSFQVKPATVHGFLGRNGAGKTTTIKLLMDFIRPSKGKLEILGKDTRANSVALKKRIGYLSGDFELYNNLTGSQYIQYMSHLSGVKNQSRTQELVEDLSAVMDRKIGLLSRGNKQKIGLIAALMNDPDILILDEPTTGLDPLMQQKFYKVVRDHAKRGKTVFMSSHILSEVQEVCDHVTFMKKGKVLETVEVSNLLAKATRRVVLTVDKNVTMMAPPKVLGASNVSHTKHTLSFDVPQADRKVMRWIAMQPVKDVTINEADLDSVFMNLYEDEEEV